MPVPAYVYPELKTVAETAFEDTVDMIMFYAQSFGEYPFINEKYGQVMVPNGGGMEHQTITHLNAQYFAHGSKPNSLIAHELAHMWWGDYITMADWPHIWLNESFATYSDALYQEYRYGSDHLKDLMWSYANKDYPGSIYDPVYLFHSIVYTKGAFVLHMLRHLVGEPQFWSILQTYYADQSFAYGNASTEDFRSICESVYGEDLSWFFNQWIYGTKRPTIRYGWTYGPAESGGTVTTITLEQVQQDLPLFRFPVDIRLETEGSPEDVTIWMETASASLQVESADAPVRVVLDPDIWLLAWQELDPGQFQFAAPEKLPQAQFGQTYDVSLELINGTPPYTIEMTDGSLPMGIELDLTDGRLEGFPLQKGTFNFTVRARDSGVYPMTAIKSFQIKALSPLAEISVRPDQPVYSGGDVMAVAFSLSNRTEMELPVTLYTVLEIDGAWYFLDAGAGIFPSFSPEPSAFRLTLPPQFSLDFVLLELPFPDPMPAISGCWWGLVIDDASGTAAGPVSMEPFQVM